MEKLFVTYMAANGPPAGRVKDCPDFSTKVSIKDMAVQNYLQLYKLVGEPLGWDQRLKMAPAELDAYLSSRNCLVFVLTVDGNEVGICEFDKSDHPIFQLMNFGLVSQAQGRGLGSYLLDFSLRSAFAAGAKKILLHTDTQDHPLAQSVYKRAGFVIESQSWQDAEGL